MKTSFFTANRHALTTRLRGGLVILSGYTRTQRTNDEAHSFDQEANFWYLTGVNEPDWVVIIDGTTEKSYLIMPDIEETHRVFDGSLDHVTAKATSGVDKVITFDEGQKLLRQLAKKHSVVYCVDDPSYADHFNFSLNPALKKHHQMLDRIFSTVQSCTKELAQLRALKQPEEIDAIKKAVLLTTKAFKDVHQKMSSYGFEYQIEADFSYHFRSTGAGGHAYDPIIAAGASACTLHYAHNANQIRTRQLVLMDVGARVDGYAADITRTFAKGLPTKRQLAVHGAVERAHYAIIALLKPELSVESYQNSVQAIMKNALAELGLLKGDENAALRRYFPHAISHGLGIDVHDSLGAPRTFQPNMVLTVEPGIYIPEEQIGVRIEDDILITNNGSKNMSSTLSTGL